MAEPKAKYKPFPKVKDWKGSGGINQRPIDFAALRELYLNGPDYDWTPFCKRNGFNDRINRDKWRVLHGVDFKDWKRQWLKNQAGMHDEEMGPQVLELRKLLTIKRVEHVRDWVTRSQYLKTLMDAVLSKHGDALRHDQHHAAMIAKKEIEPKFTCTVEDVNDMAAAALRIQELETRALLIGARNSDHVTMPGGLNPGQAEGDASGDGTGETQPPEFTVATMGAAGLNAAESARLLAAWFDQAPELPALPKPPEQEVQADASGDPG